MKVVDFDSSGIPNRYNIFESGGDIIAYNLIYEDAMLFKYAYEMRDAMQEFVDRVDNGEIKSRKTYEKFKSIIEKTKDL